MYRDAHQLPHRPETPAPSGRKVAPVPLGVFAGLLALAGEFFGLFLLAWGMAPTSLGCGAERAISVSAALIPVSLAIWAGVTWAGMGLMRESRESQLRRRSFVIITTAIYVLGAIPLFRMAALF